MTAWNGSTLRLILPRKSRKNAKVKSSSNMSETQYGVKRVAKFKVRVEYE